MRKLFVGQSDENLNSCVDWGFPMLIGRREIESNFQLERMSFLGSKSVYKNSECTLNHDSCCSYTSQMHHSYDNSE